MTVEIIEDRAYQSGQGYEMTRIVKYAGNELRVNHTLRVVVHAGNSREYAYATVERWDGDKWREVVKQHAYELREAPSYVTWSWTRESHPSALATNEECMEWLHESYQSSLAYAIGVLG